MACSLTTALHMNLQDLTLTHNKRLKRVAAERDDAYRTEWILNMTMNYTTDQLVFLDKYNKDERVALRRYGQGAALFSHSHKTSNIELSHNQAPNSEAVFSSPPDLASLSVLLSMLSPSDPSLSSSSAGKPSQLPSKSSPSEYDIL